MQRIAPEEITNDAAAMVRRAVAACQARGLSAATSLLLFCQLTQLAANIVTDGQGDWPDWLAALDRAAYLQWVALPAEERQLPAWPHCVPE